MTVTPLQTPNVQSHNSNASHGDRLCHPVSRTELERRWSLVREQMAIDRIDALVLHGANGYAGAPGYFRWLTGIPVMNSYPQVAIFSRDSDTVLIHHGAFNGRIPTDPSDPEFQGVGLRLTTPSFPAIHYAAGYEADLAADEIERAGYSTVALVGAASAYSGFVDRLRTRLAPKVLTDWTDPVDEMKADKSAEEWNAIRATAQMQDRILEEVGKFIRPGMRDFEVTAYGHYLGQLYGSEGGYMLGTSAAPGQAAQLRHRPFQNREIRQGDVVMFQAENAGPGGYYTHLGRIFVLGKAPAGLADAFQATVEAQRVAVDMLQPGASSKDVFDAYNAYMRGRKLPEEKRLHCHGQGYEVVERPLIRSDESMILRAGMNIGIHPVVAAEQHFATVCDNFEILKSGPPERLHKTAQAIFEL